MKRGKLALLGWMFFLGLPIIAAKSNYISEHNENEVYVFLLCFALSLLCCFWGALRKHSYFYTEVTEFMNNSVVNFVLHYNLTITRIFLTLFFMCVLCRFERLWLTIVTLCIIVAAFIIYAVISYLSIERVKVFLQQNPEKAPEYPVNTAFDLFPIWAIVVVFIVVILVAILI